MSAPRAATAGAAFCHRLRLRPQVCLAATCGAYALGAALGWGSPRLARLMGDFGLSAAALLAAASCLWYARTRGGRYRPAWALFGAASLMMCLGNAVWGWYEVMESRPVPFTSLADVCFLLFAPFSIFGLLMLAKRPVNRAGWICLALDAWLVGGSLLALSWSVALAHTAHRQGVSLSLAAFSLAYPIMDIALVSVALVLHFRRGAAHRSAVNTVIGALALTVLCDALFTSAMLRQNYQSGRLLDAGWFAGSLLLAYAPWAASRPVSRQESAGGDGDAPAVERPLIGSLAALTPYLAVAVCTLSILISGFNDRQVDRVIVLTASTVVLALLVRQGITLMENISLTRELAQQENHFRSVVQGSSDVIMIAGTDGRLSYISPAAAGVYGQQADRLAGGELSALIHPEDLGRVLHELRRFQSAAAAGEPATRIECRVRHGSGHWLNVESSVNRYQGGLLFNSRDVTERVRLQAQLQHSASHDGLTDLPNRTLFTERVRLALGGCGGGDADAAVLFIDLDGFKAVNDSSGHQAGDELLIQAARRLHEAVRAQDTVARLGGDEFAALVLTDASPGSPPREGRILEIAERIRAELSRPYRVDGRELRVAASIGIAFAEPGSTPNALMRDADEAMYRAKQAGKARVELHAPPAHAGPPLPAWPGDRRRGAQPSGGLRLLHQPVVELADGLVAAVSALARRHAGPGLLPAPREVLTAAAAPLAATPPPRPGTMAADVTRWLIEEAIAEAGRRRRQGLTIPVSVRVPGGRLADRSLAVGLEELLTRHELPPEALTIELPEAEPVLAAEEPRRRLKDLRRLGVGIGLGGFGGAATAPSALHRLPVDLVRLDREVVDGLVYDRTLRTVAAGLVRLAADLGITSLADGVDLPEQAAALRALGCRRAQGMAVCEPLEADPLRRVLGQGRLPVPPETGGSPMVTT